MSEERGEYITNPLNPVEQKQVAFYDDQITAVRVEDGTVYVPIRPICELLGLAWQGQNERINRDAILSQVAGSVSVTLTEPNRTRNISMKCLPLDYLNGWLFGINANRVKDSVRDGLLKYQMDCYRVLADAFLRNEVTHRPTTANIDEWLKTNDDPTAVAYRHAMAIANLAREQALMKAEVDERFESAELLLSDYGTRLESIEAELGNADRFITTSQTGELLDAIRAIGVQLTKMTGSNSFGATHGEFHRRFSINSYKKLPAAKFDDAMNWLRGWFEDLTDGDAAPF